MHKYLKHGNLQEKAEILQRHVRQGECHFPHVPIQLLTEGLT